MNPKSDSGADGSGKLRLFIVCALIVLGLFALALGAWRVREAYLLAFASILVAVLLTASAAPVRRWTGLSRTWSLVAAGSAIVVTLALFGWLVGSRLQSQVAELAGTLPNREREHRAAIRHRDPDRR